MPNIEIITLPSGPFETNTYLVICTKTKEAAIIDAPPESTKKLFDTIKKLGVTPTKLILTHSHWDHIGDAAHLCQTFSIPVLVHEEDAYNLATPGADGL